VDIVFFLYVVINSLTDEYSSPGEKADNISIIKAYASSGMIFLDLLGCVPGIITLEKPNGGISCTT